MSFALAPVVLLVGSLAWRDGAAHPAGLGVMALACAGGALNFHLSFVRPFFRQRHVSGVPLLGTLLVAAGGLLGFGSPWCACMGLLALLTDTGGWPWFVLSTWNDECLWNAPRS